MRVPRQSSWLLRLLFLLWIQEAAMNVVPGQDCTANCQMTTHLGLVGSSVELSCFCHKNQTMTLSKRIVYWQTVEKKPELVEVVHVFTEGQDSYTWQNKGYTNRTQLFREEKEGNFTLRLSNLTLRDSKNYSCIVLLNGSQMKTIHQKCAPLKVAARFSHPVLTGPTDVNFGQVVYLSCSSSKGHPAPKLYWIDSEDGSVIDPSLSKTDIDTDSDTQLHSVRSKLTLNATANRKIRCLVENPVLKENLTSRQYNIQVLSDRSHHEKQSSTAKQATVWVLIVVLLAGLVLGVWLYKKRFCDRYRGIPTTETDLQLQTTEQRAPLNGSPLLQTDNGEPQSGISVNIEEPFSCKSGNEAETVPPHEGL